MAREEGHLRGIALMLAAFALFPITDSLAKHLSATYPLPQTVFFIAVFALVPVVGLALATGGPRQLATRRPGVQAARAVLGLGVGYGAFFAFSHMPIADAYAILFASPVIIAALSATVLRERIDLARWIAILAGFGGVLVMLRPSAAVIDRGALGALGSALCYAVSALVVRRMGRGETAASFPFYSNLLAVAALAPTLPYLFVPPTPGDFALLALAGMASGCALICLLNAFRLAPSPVVAPFQYTEILWGVVIGYAAFGDVPDGELLLGAAVVVASGLYLLRREAAAFRSVGSGGPDSGAA